MGGASGGKATNKTKFQTLYKQKNAPGSSTNRSRLKSNDRQEQFAKQRNIETNNSKSKDTNKDIEETGSNISTNNSFSIFNTTQTDDINLNNEHLNTKHEEKPVPIVVLDKDISKIQALIHNMVPSLKFELKIVREGVRVNIINPSEHTKTVEELEKMGIPYHFYYTTQTRPIKIVLHGLLDMTDKETEAILHEHNIFPEKISKLHIKQPLHDKQVIYLLYFRSNIMQIKELQKIKALNNLIVRWERYRPRRHDKVAQCRNCQRLGHSSENCHAPPRCVVCAENHSTKDCTKKIARQTLKQQEVMANGPKPDRSFIKCALCNGNHTASYLGCKERIRYLEVQEKLLQKNRPRYTNKTHLNINYNTNFPRLNHTIEPNKMYSTQHNSIQPDHFIPQKTPHNFWNNTIQHTSSDKLMETLTNVLQTMQQMMAQMSQMMNMFLQQTQHTSK